MIFSFEFLSKIKQDEILQQNFQNFDLRAYPGEIAAA
jgi:hypothetical protein